MVSKSSEGTLIEFSSLLDLFFSEYGWSVSQTLKLTYFQIVVFSGRINDRQGEERQRISKIIRYSNNADDKGFEEFINSLSPKQRNLSNLSGLPTSDLPTSDLPTSDLSLKVEEDI